MSDDGDSSSPWTRPSVFLSIALLVFAIVAGSIVLVKSHHSTGPAAAAPVLSTPAVMTSALPPSATPSATPSTTRSRVPVASIAVPEQTIPVTGPPATWITVATLALPTSPLYGPKVNDGTVMAGYQHSPTGALFADADNRGRFAAVADWRAATLAAVADTPGRAAFLVIRAADGVVVPTPGQFTQLAGFNYLSYTSTRAVIQFLSTASDGSLIVTADTVVWEHGDWKVLLPASGEPPAGSLAQSSQGFIPWMDNR